MEDDSRRAGPTVAVLEDLVKFESGSVVSRVLMKSAAGTVTVFAFEAGEGLSEHTAPYDALVYVLEGRTEIRISGEPYLLRDGETITLPGGQPHALRALERLKLLLIMIRS